MRKTKRRKSSKRRTATPAAAQAAIHASYRIQPDVLRDIQRLETLTGWSHAKSLNVLARVALQAINGDTKAGSRAAQVIADETRRRKLFGRSFQAINKLRLQQRQHPNPLDKPLPPTPLRISVTATKLKEAC